jgi:membrane protein implicated in regulation of membrane protease activity
MNTVYLICFVLGLAMSLLAAFGGLGRIHFGHAHVHTHVPGQARHPGSFSAINGFTLPAFLCWFGGAGYLMNNYSPLITPVVLMLAAMAGLVGAGILYVILFRVLLPREQVLTAEDTRMDGVVARVSDAIRAGGGTGEILFTQTGARRGAAARSESGEAIERGTEVVVLRYEKGIAYVSPLEEFSR